MATPEEITITVRELHAACQATQTAPPDENVIVSRGNLMILLAWQDNDKARTASIVDGKLTPPEE